MEVILTSAQRRPQAFLQQVLQYARRHLREHQIAHIAVLHLVVDAQAEYAQVAHVDAASVHLIPQLRRTARSDHSLHTHP